MENRVAPLEGACKNYEEDLVLYYYGESGAAERAAMEQHMAQCGRCRNFIDDLGRVLPQMAPQPELPQPFWDSYFRETMAKVDAHEARQSWWSDWFAPLNGWLMPAFGTMAVAALAIALVLEKSDMVSFIDTPAPAFPPRCWSTRISSNSSNRWKFSNRSAPLKNWMPASRSLRPAIFITGERHRRLRK